MKQSLKKLKGSSLMVSVGELTLTDIYREDHCEYDQMYFFTNLESTICKIYDIEQEISLRRFLREKTIYQQQLYHQLAQCLTAEQIKIKKKSYGLVLLGKISKAATIFDIGSTLTIQEVIILTETVISFLTKLRDEKQVFLNLKPMNICRTIEGDFVMINPQFSMREGSINEIEGENYYLMEIVQKQYHYHSPELLDQYSKAKIDYQSDLFSFGCILYEMIHKIYPFQSKFATINFSLRESLTQSIFNPILTAIFQKYNSRPSLQALTAILQTQKKNLPKENKQMNSNSTNPSKSNIFSNLNQIISKLTTETEGWYLSYTENDQNTPDQKYLNQMLSKLYKKQAKMQKLQAIISKYLEQNLIEFREYFSIKTLLLLWQLFRKGPNTMNYNWEVILNQIEQSNANIKHILLAELLKVLKWKIQLNQKIKMIFKGNFSLEEASKFKQLTIINLQSMQIYLKLLIDSIYNKIIMNKQPEQNSQLCEYVIMVYCDEILQLISMLILSVICIRKDNELQLRKDDLVQVAQFEKNFSPILKKISGLANYINGHAIYSLEVQYFYYQEEIYLKEKPTNTTFEHFLKYSREYKGLAIPNSYASTYNTGQLKPFLSNDKIQKKKSTFFPDPELSDEDIQEASEKYQSSKEEIQIEGSLKSLDPKNSGKLDDEVKKKQISKKVQLLFNIKPNTNQKLISQNKKNGQLKKKQVAFDDFFSVASKNVPPSNLSPKKQEIKIVLKPKEEKQKKVDFSFFQTFLDEKKDSDKSEAVIQKSDKSANSFFDNFGLTPKSKNTNSQKLITENILSYDWLEKSSATKIKVNIPVAVKASISEQLLAYILNGLKLRELREMIESHGEVVIEFGRLKLQKVIGSGSAGEVYLGKCGSEVVAIKKVKAKQNPNALKQFERQLLTYIKIKKHPYLVSLIGLSKSEEDYYLLTEFCNHGSMFDLLHKRAHDIPLSWPQKIDLALQIAKGMLALHSMKPSIIHRDLKSLNVFVSWNDGRFIAKVADFGLSRSPESQMMTMCLGTLHWMAPELLDNQSYSIKVDVYSYAILLWEICSRKTPYNELSNPMAIIKHVMDKKRPKITEISQDCPPQLLDIIVKCWAHDPNERPFFNQVIEKLIQVKI